jgi:hypothetical protein
MINERLKILVSPVFVIILCLLLVNDFLLKPLFHNWATGKLSDLAGLFVFPLFFCAFCPRYKKTIYALTAILFCCWKSAYSQPLIDAWNALAIMPVSRVIDPSDMIALLALPFSYSYSHRKQRYPLQRFAALPIALLSVFAFVATSYHTELEYSSVYQFEESKIELLRKIHHLGDLNREYTVSCEPGRAEDAGIKIEIPSNFCSPSVSALIVIGENEGKSTITLRKMGHRCPKGNGDQKQLADVFEREFVDKVKEIKLVYESYHANVDESESSDRFPLVRANPLYLVAIGEVPGLNIKDLASQLSAGRRLSIRILRPIPLGDNLRYAGSPTSRPVAEKLVEAMKLKHPDIVGNSAASIIAFTKDMYVSSGDWREQSNYQSEGRFAVIAIDSLNPSTFCEPENTNLLLSRLKKVLAADIGALCYHLPPSNDPGSVMYRSTGCVHELDGMRNELLDSEGRRSGR